METDELLLMIQILHYLNDPKLWELWYIPYYGKYRIYIITRTNRRLLSHGSRTWTTALSTINQRGLGSVALKSLPDG